MMTVEARQDYECLQFERLNDGPWNSRVAVVKYGLTLSEKDAWLDTIRSRAIDVAARYFRDAKKIGYKLELKLIVRPYHQSSPCSNVPTQLTLPIKHDDHKAP